MRRWRTPNITTKKKSKGKGKVKIDLKKRGPSKRKWSLALKRDVAKAAKYYSSVLTTRMSLAKKIAQVNYFSKLNLLFFDSFFSDLNNDGASVVKRMT